MVNDIAKKNMHISVEHTEYLKKLKRRSIAIKTAQLILVVSFFVLWEVAANLKWIDPFIFSSTSRIIEAFVDMALSGEIWRHIGITVYETVLGFALSTVIGTLIAILLWWNKFISDVLEPYLVVLNSLPKTALAPIIIVWMGNNMKSIIFTALMTSVIVTILTVLNGFLSVDKEKIKLIYTFGGNKKTALKKVVLPSNIPIIISALKINVGLSFVGVIVGEFLVAKAGLGFLIVYGSQVFKLSWVMMSVLILAILAAVLYKLIVLLETKFMKWSE